jgi:hypothetical protein
VTRIFVGLLLFAAIAVAREWSVFVYMVADNDLAQWADSDLVELQEVGSTDEVAFVVQVDKPSIGARRLYILQGTVQEEQNLGVIDMCDWNTLAGFLEWGIRDFPAKKYCIVLWDHGTGWTMMPQRTFGYDGSSGNRMSIANGDLRKALSTACSYTGETIDLVAFDACLMQQVEIAYELYDLAYVMTGPQSVCPVAGFRYDMVGDSLTAQPGISAATLAGIMVRTTIAHYTNVQPVAYSAISIKALKAVGDDLYTFVQSIKNTGSSSHLVMIRDSVQTIPISGNPPDPDNDFVDLGDWLRRMNTVLGTGESQALYNAYLSAIVSAESWGSGFSNTSGLSVWFPYTYPGFKQLIDTYCMLSWIGSSWASFLNWFYDSDDIRPTQVSVSSNEPGNDNDFLLSWTNSFDLADVQYSIIECGDTASILYEPCEDTVNWYMNGFTLSTNNVYSGTFSFFSGNTGSADHFLRTKNPIALDSYGLLSVYLWYNTEDMTDSLTIMCNGIYDVHYGRSGGWIERRVLIPEGTDYLEVTYTTNTSINNGGCYIDDVRIYELHTGRFARQGLNELSLYMFNKERGDYTYFVRPEDTYGNLGNISLPVGVRIQEFAAPYANPNPFQDACMIVLDYPDSLDPSVEIFSLAGRSVRRFTGTDINNKAVYWDGKDHSGQETGSGLYFILVTDGSFKMIGKIARQR